MAAATVTVPVDVNVDGIAIPTGYPVDSVMAKASGSCPAQVTDVTRMTLPAPILRWNGSGWVQIFTPTI